MGGRVGSAVPDPSGLWWGRRSSTSGRTGRGGTTLAPPTALCLPKCHPRRSDGLMSCPVSRVRRWSRWPGPRRCRGGRGLQRLERNAARGSEHFNLTTGDPRTRCRICLKWTGGGAASDCADSVRGKRVGFRSPESAHVVSLIEKSDHVIKGHKRAPCSSVGTVSRSAGHAAHLSAGRAGGPAESLVEWSGQRSRVWSVRLDDMSTPVSRDRVAWRRLNGLSLVRTA